MSFTLYVVFHKFLVPECYETLFPEALDKLRFLAVNANIPKVVPEDFGHLVIAERNLPWYDPFLQYNRFCESSAFFHVWKNAELLNDYIGFFHYDMLIEQPAIDCLEQEIKALGNEKVLFTNVTLTARPHIKQILQLDEWNQIIQLYNAMFGKNHTIFTVLDEELPMYHSFVVHKDTFNRMMTFAEKAIPCLFELIGFDTKHLPFMLERLHGIFLALERIDGRVSRWIPLPGITHLDRLKDSWR
jgi:hypothetical protein